MNPLTNKQIPEAPASPIKRLLDVKRYALVLAALWTLIVVISLTWNVSSELKVMREMAD